MSDDQASKNFEEDFQNLKVDLANYQKINT